VPGFVFFEGKNKGVVEKAYNLEHCLIFNYNIKIWKYIITHIIPRSGKNI
jgi:hypothetical protein